MLFRSTEQVRQQDDPDFGALCRQVGRGSFPDAPLPLNATTDVMRAYGWAQPFVENRNSREVELSGMIVAGTNGLVDEHNEALLERFPGPRIILNGVTRVERSSHAGDEPGALNPQAVLPEVAYGYAPTGLPRHKLEVKIGVPLMIIRTVMHPDLVNGKVLILARFKRNRVLYLQTQEENQSERRTFILHRIDFLFQDRKSVV